LCRRTIFTMTINSLDPPKKQVKLVQQQAPPLLTALLVVGMIFVYWSLMGKDPAVVPEFAFKPASIVEFVATQQWPKLAFVWLSANFGAINLWQLGFGLYFLGLFGVPVEKRIGPARLLLLFLLGSTIPWVVQYWDTGNAVISLFPGEHLNK